MLTHWVSALFHYQEVTQVDNPLKNTQLDLTPAEEWDKRVELIEQTDTSLYDLQKRKTNIERKRQDLDVDRKERNLDSVEELNQSIAELVREVSDPTIAARLMKVAKDGKDYNEMVKAVQGVVKLRDDMLDHTYDESSGTGKKKKIAVAFQTQGVKVAIGVETDG